MNPPTYDAEPRHGKGLGEGGGARVMDRVVQRHGVARGVQRRGDDGPQFAAAARDDGSAYYAIGGSRAWTPASRSPSLPFCRTIYIEG